MLKKPSSGRIVSRRGGSYSPRTHEPMGEGSDSSDDDNDYKVKNFDGFGLADYNIETARNECNTYNQCSSSPSKTKTQ